MTALLPDGPPVSLGVAVSGGGDSIALLALLSAWCGSRDTTLHVATVNHGLRPEAPGEAAHAAALATRLGLSHDILNWDQWDGQGNLQDRARQARRELLSNWAMDRRIAVICLGHTRDDQAETVLMRLSRGSGVDGLAAMAPSRQDPVGLLWLRPLLTIARRDLRVYLEERGIAWCEDPSNADPRFDRVRTRQLLPKLSQLGLTAETLVATATRMAAARKVLAGAARSAAERIVEIQDGDLLIDANPYADLPDDLRWRILSAALQWVTGAPYRPRFRALCDVDSALLAQRRSTLQGCLVSPGKVQHRVGREPAAVTQVRGPAPGIWDNRWRIEGPAGRDLTVGALGADGIEVAGGRQEKSPPRDTLLASPAVWRNGALVAAPLLGYGSDWRAGLLRAMPDYFQIMSAD